MDTQQSPIFFYDSLVETLPINLFRKDLNGRFTFANQRFCALVGKPLKQIVGKTDADFYPPELAENYRRDDLWVIESGNTLEKEEAHHTPEGDELYVQVIKVPVKDHQGQVVEVQAVFWDITERKQAEKQLRASEDRFRMLAEEVHLIPWEADARTWQFTYVGGRAADILGYSREAWLADDFWIEHIHPEDRDRAVRICRESSARLDNYEFEYRMVSADGTTVWLRDIVNVVRDSAGPKLLRGFMIDISESKRVEESLRETQNWLHLAENAGGIGTYDWDILSNKARCSPAYFRLYGLEPGDQMLSEEEWLSRVYPEDRTRCREEVERALAGEPYDTEYRVVWPDGAVHWLNSKAKVFFDDADHPVRMTGAQIDVTKRKQAEQERLQLESKMQQAQKLESLGLLAGGIAHDFNNLLTAILGHADLALAELPADSTAHDNIERVVDGATRASELSLQMLAYSGKGKLVTRPMDLSELVGNTADLIQVSVSKKAHLLFDLAEDLPSIDGDKAQLQQIIINLIINASEALEGVTGIITVRTGMLRWDGKIHPDTFVSDEKLPPGDYVSLFVSDTGCGIEANKLARIFDPFFTTKFTGRGLGLAALLGIVRGHHGAVHVSSEMGRGTTFHVLLPPGRRLAVPTMAPVQDRQWQSHGVVLVVDDEESVRTLCVHMVRKIGFSVLAASNGAEAVEIFRTNADPIAAVILDLTMPGLDGFETFSRLQQIRRDVPVLLSSGYGPQAADMQNAVKGFKGFLAKPYRLEELQAALRRAIETGNLSSQPVLAAMDQCE